MRRWLVMDAVARPRVAATAGGPQTLSTEPVNHRGITTTVTSETEWLDVLIRPVEPLALPLLDLLICR